MTCADEIFGRRRVVVRATGSVEADDGVEVDRSALLELGDLAEGDSAHLLQGRL
jgi:hypothetical protein